MFGTNPAGRPNDPPGATTAGRSEPSEQSRTRQSPGLEQFFVALRDTIGLSILDFAGASQANIGFITSLGHRIYSEDFLRTLELSFGGEGDFYENQADQERIDSFFQQTLTFPDGHFDGALIWDCLQYMNPVLLQQTLEQLRRILRPNAYLLAFFHADEKVTNVPLYSYRIVDQKTLLLCQRGTREPAQFFNNRALERVFSDFQSIKFFLTRDHLREVIVKR
jgi:hypothetical protein